MTTLPDGTESSDGSESPDASSPEKRERRASRSRWRIVDANLNRASEGLRVAEDVCRFHHEQRGLAGELKRLRHELLVLGEMWPLAVRLEARDADGDVGRESGIAPQNIERDLSVASLGTRNLRRAAEAIRVLEEIARGSDPERAGSFERLRYATYQLGRALETLSGKERDERLRAARVYLLATRSLCRGDFEVTVREALDAGVDIVQMREKSGSDRELLALARSLRDWTARAGAVFFINDRPDLASLADADGVHLGQDDLDVASARRVLDASGKVGVSTHSVDDAERAIRDGADLIGVGPMFPTRTKSIPEILGPAGLKRVLAVSSETLPAFAIGGITPANVTELVQAGARGVAVSSAVLSSDAPGRVVRSLREALERG